MRLDNLLGLLSLWFCPSAQCQYLLSNWWVLPCCIFHDIGHRRENYHEELDNKTRTLLDKLSVYFHWNINLTGVDLTSLLGVFVRD